MSLRLRNLAEVNPSTPEFDRLSPLDDVTFMPLEAVWGDSRADLTRVRPRGEVSTGYTRFRDGDVLVPKVAPTFQAGRATVVNGLVRGVGAGSTELHVLRPKPNVDARFLRYVVQSKPFLSEGVAAFQGVAGLQRVPDDFLRDFSVGEFSLAEQRNIANYLDAEAAYIDRLAELQREVRARLVERDQALLDLELDTIAARAGTLPLRRFIVGMDQGASPQCEAVRAGELDWGVLKVSSLRPGKFFASENKRLPDDVSPDFRSEIRAGDLLITRANTPGLVGSAAVVPKVRKRLLLSDKIFRVRLNSDISPQYVAVVARGRRVRDLCAASSHGTSSSMVNLKFEDIKAWPVPLADMEDQLGLVSRVLAGQREVERIISAIDRQLALLTERRQALITAAVTGQLDVTTARGADV